MAEPEDREMNRNVFLGKFQEKLETIKFEMKDALWYLKEEGQKALGNEKQVKEIKLILTFATSTVSQLSDRITEIWDEKDAKGK